MTRRERARRTRRRLDAELGHEAVRALADRPDQGRMREMRDALGMTTRQLALRMGVSQSAVSQLERSEIADGIRLESLRRAAEALECDLVYALVPRTTLERTMRDRARVLARRDLGTDNVLEESIEHYAERLVENGRLWDVRDAD
jgi:predicted DNA-binding mobile mystery protein A